MLYAYGFIGLFPIGGLTGLFLATLGTDIHMHDTYFVVAHFHYIMVGGSIMGYLGGLHFWWPKITGRMYSEFLVADQRDSGVRRLQPDVLPAVHPRLPRDAAPLSRVPAEFQVLNVMSSAGATILGVGYVLPVLYFPVVAEAGRSRRPEPVGRLGPGMGDARRRRRRKTSPSRRA